MIKSVSAMDRFHPCIRVALSYCVACAVACVLSLAVLAQQNKTPVVVQPGAPGQPTKTLLSSTRPTLPSATPADVQFMQHMIMHHAQAVEMTALIESHTDNKEIQTLGDRISRSQSDEIKFMTRWLRVRGHGSGAGGRSRRQETHTHGAHDSGNSLMPGMLSVEQMDALRNAKGKEFDRLFLSGMIQHHNGALVMVKELFDTAGAGQDAELFNFASDVDSGQRAEIRRMEQLLARQ
ncbi:MAG TPA: DUF305 domain-containing protein [Pyrinomonadaceae bacterium]|nr:DUF305 domain-containing protein [Pyrinomonadaceae bacterium]